MRQPDFDTWPDEIFRTLLNYRVRQVAYVPDAGHARLIELCCASDEMIAVLLTSEEEGVALLAGAWLGGERGVLLLQSSGVGNCINMLCYLLHTQMYAEVLASSRTAPEGLTVCPRALRRRSHYRRPVRPGPTGKPLLSNSSHFTLTERNGLTVFAPTTTDCYVGKGQGNDSPDILLSQNRPSSPDRKSQAF